MSLFESMGRDLGLVKRVDIQEVRMNKLNFYEYQDDVINSFKKFNFRKWTNGKCYCLHR